MSTRASVQVHSAGLPRAVAWTAVPWLWLILSLGAILRLATLGNHSLWLDEGLSYWIANRSLSDLVDYLGRRDTHPPLHYLLLQPMIALGGDAWLLRLPSALAGIISIGLLYRLGVELFDRRTALVAAFILAISPLHLWHAQEARMYALVAALTLAAGLCAVRALRTNRPVAWAGLIVCQALALWTNTAAIWFTLALNLAALLMVVTLWRQRRFWPWVAAQALVVGLWLPWLPMFLQQVRVSGSANSWIPPATFSQVGVALADFISQGGPDTVKWAALLLLLGGLTLGARGLARAALGARGDYLLLGCWLAVPIGLAFLISQQYVQVPGLSLLFKPGSSIFLTRSLMVATFPLYLLLARGLVLASQQGPGARGQGSGSENLTHHPALVARLRPALLPGFLVVLVGLNVVSHRDNLLVASPEDWRGAAMIIAEQATPDDLLIFAPSYLEAPFAYYYQRLGGTGARRGYPHDDVAVHAEGPIYPSAEALLAGHHRVWLVTSSGHGRPSDETMVAAVLDRGQLLYEWRLQGVAVRRLELDGETQ